MSATVTRRRSCRLCDSTHVECVVELQPIPLSENYMTTQDVALKVPRFPVDVYMCADCGHVQQLDVIDTKNLWESYTYYSGDAKGMPEHFEQVAQQIRRKIKLSDRQFVVDIGSNDGSLLKPFKQAGFAVLGVDPAKEVARKANESGIPTIPDVISLELAQKIRATHGPASIVCAFNVFAHSDDLGEMADAVRVMLGPDGLFFFEAQYLLDVLDGVLVATIFHEHMSHHSVKPLVRFLDRHGLELIAIERVRIQHGSLIGTVQQKGGPRQVEPSVRELLALEDERHLDQLGTLRAFDERVKQLRLRTTQLAAEWKTTGATVAGFGAARSGPTLIAQLGLTGAIQYIVDDHPEKVGRFTSGDGILVVPTSELCARQPDYTVILAWVHSQKIIETNLEYLYRGGHFVVLCPEMRIVSKAGDISV